MRWRPGPISILCVSLLAISSCGAQQQAAEKLIDPRLREQGVLVERHGRDLELGHYRVEDLQVDEQPFDGTGPLAPNADGRTRPTQQWRLHFTLRGGETPWDVQCVGQRRQPPDHDLAAAADELRDEVAVRCQLAGAAQRWTLRIDGSLAANMTGELASLDDSARSKVVEVVMWHRLWNVSRRRLPASLALIHGHAESEAALILDAPERAWLAPQLDEQERSLALASMLALRLLPLGFDN
ncbi:MAG TPA: hypothetical protein VM869_07700 [Enhygromyxa sp.]|nr:hypothetical protein [Enhygromyxa sp.]